MENSIHQNSNIEEPINQVNPFNLGSLLEVFFRRKKIFILASLGFFLIGSSYLIFKRVKNPIYRGSFTLMISDPFMSKGSSTIENLALNRESFDIGTLIQYLRSPGALSKVAIDNNISPNSLSNKVKITIGNNAGGLKNLRSKTLNIFLEGKQKLQMKNILEDLSEEYVINASDLRNEKLSEGIKFLNNEKPTLLAKVKESQVKLEKFRLENTTLDPIKEASSITSSIKDNQKKILEINSENLRLNFIKEQLLKGVLYTQGISASGSTTNSTGLNVNASDALILNKILNLKDEITVAQSKYKESSIVIRNLKDKLSQLEPILIENLKSTVDAAITVNNILIKTYENQILELKKKFIPIPTKVTEYSAIQQEINILEKNLINLNNTKDKLELELSQGVLPWKILQKPFVNPSPIKPDMNKNFIYILFYTFVFASLITFLVEKLDDVFHNPKEVEKFINLPILGFVPFFNFEDAISGKEFEKDNEKDKLFININDLLEFNKKEFQNNFKFIFEETFRNIYTSIKFSQSDKDIKIINVTSTIPEEGKSLCSLFLAMNIAQLSKKVLIIDTDLRKPSLHKRLEVDNISGISNYLVNSDSDWNKYVNVHKSNKNLHYLTAGKIPPNSITLLESEKMAGLIENLKNAKEYDFIILDCPPLLGLSDALIISKYVDASILTVSLNKVKKSLAVDCLQKIKTTNKPIIGTIINSVSKNPNTKIFENGYYSYSNQYSYYSYKYMPEETQNRYQSNDKKDNIKEILKDKTLLEKAKNILKNFIKWINE